MADGKQGMFAGTVSRWPALLPILDPERVADRIFEAIQAKDEVVLIPRILHAIPLVKSLLPVPAFDALVEFLGGLSCMDGFVGREGAAAAVPRVGLSMPD
jgi:all-trans-retinol dehydrogenase (NAD+)